MAACCITSDSCPPVSVVLRSGSQMSRWYRAAALAQACSPATRWAAGQAAASSAVRLSAGDHCASPDMNLLSCAHLLSESVYRLICHLYKLLARDIFPHLCILRNNAIVCQVRFKYDSCSRLFALQSGI